MAAIQVVPATFVHRRCEIIPKAAACIDSPSAARVRTSNIHPLQRSRSCACMCMQTPRCEMRSPCSSLYLRHQVAARLSAVSPTMSSSPLRDCSLWSTKNQCVCRQRQKEATTSLIPVPLLSPRAVFRSYMIDHILCALPRKSQITSDC